MRGSIMARRGWAGTAPDKAWDLVHTSESHVGTTWDSKKHRRVFFGMIEAISKNEGIFQKRAFCATFGPLGLPGLQKQMIRWDLVMRLFIHATGFNNQSNSSLKFDDSSSFDDI